MSCSSLAIWVLLLLGICSFSGYHLSTNCMWSTLLDDYSQRYRKTNMRSLLSNLPTWTEFWPCARHFPFILTTSPSERHYSHLYLRIWDSRGWHWPVKVTQWWWQGQDSNLSLLFLGSWGSASLKELADPMADQVVAFMQPLSWPKISFSVNSCKVTD